MSRYFFFQSFAYRYHLDNNSHSSSYYNNNELIVGFICVVVPGKVNNITASFLKKTSTVFLYFLIAAIELLTCKRSPLAWVYGITISSSRPTTKQDFLTPVYLSTIN